MPFKKCEIQLAFSNLCEDGDELMDPKQGIS
jgi:hypothetical protein